MQRLVFFSLILFAPAIALAHDVVRATEGWAPPSLSQPNGVGFITLNAPNDDKLVGATSDCCDVIELHTHVEEGDVVRMRKIDAVPLPDHQDVTLAPGGYHLMLIGLKQPLKDGDTVPVELTFEHAAPVQTTLEVSRGKLLQKLQQSRMHQHH